MATFRIQDREAGNIIEDCIATREQAENMLKQFEAEDRANNTYTPDFYEIVTMQDKPKEHTIYIDNAICCDCYEDFSICAVIQEFKENGFNVTRKAIQHNYDAWKSDYKSGYLDEENGYFLFTPCGCNALRFEVMELNGEDWQETYIA